MNTIQLFSILFLLGIYHGINPAMGWLFAVALGLQKSSRASVGYSIAALTLGHAAAITMTLVIVGILELTIPTTLTKTLVAVLLALIGFYSFIRSSHPTWFGLRIGYIGVFGFSFVMAMMHGAGLMLVPFLLGITTPSSAMHHGHHLPEVLDLNILIGILAVITHTLGYVISTTIIAFVVYEKLGVAILKKIWINFDIIWAITLVITALFVMFS